MWLAGIILLPLAGAALVASLRVSRGVTASIAAAVTAVALALLLIQAPSVFAGEVVLTGLDWLPALGLNLLLRLDGLGLLFCLLILGIGLLVILYAYYYLGAEEPAQRFYAFLLLFMVAMLGVVLSENLLLMVVFWELTSISSFLLIGYWYHRSDARQGARMALTITGAGGLALLGGVLLLGAIVGSFDLSDVLAAGPRIKNDPLYPWATALILLGAFTKSAQFPFHFWLPHAMAAPTPVSAYLHSATMVKAGIFLMARLSPALAGTEFWIYVVSVAGLLTLLFAAYVALFQHDLKGLLAYSTLSHLGLITLLLGMGTPLSEVAAVFHIINHAIFKASLFMAAGIIDHEAGTRDMRKINGLFKYMPHTAVLAMVAAAAMAGVPLFNGFLSKEMFFGESLHRSLMGEGYWLLPVAATLAGVFSVAYSLRFIHDVFFNGEPVGLNRTPHEPPRWMKVPVEILVGLCVLVGVLPSVTVGPILALASASVLGDRPLPEYSLAVWHGFNLPLVMSLIALAGGAVVYAGRRRLFALHERYQMPEGKRLFDACTAWLVSTAGRITNALDNGSLQRYLGVLIASAVIYAGWPLLRHRGLSGPFGPSDVNLLGIAAATVLLISAVGTVLAHRQRLTALVLLSVIGLIVALAFARFSAPDLALTQLAVEVVTVLLLLLALYFLPQQTPRESSLSRRWRDAGLAVAAGLGAAALTWGVLSRPYDTIADYFLEHSVPLGGGSNVVNVILVDFRGFDTLGEITVLAIAALSVVALLHGVHLAAPRVDPRGAPWARDRHPLILRAVALGTLPIMLLVAAYIFLRGHNLPGGGFIAGLTVALALILQYLAMGIRSTQRRFTMDYRLFVGYGLFIATLTGLTSWLFDYPFLTSTHTHLHFPVIGDIELASAMAFDTGVLFTVVGIVLLILYDLAKLGDRDAPTSAGNAANNHPLKEAD